MYKRKINPIEVAANLENSVLELNAMLKTRNNNRLYIKKRRKIPKNPNSSPMTEKIKSEWPSGTKSN